MRLWSDFRVGMGQHRYYLKRRGGMEDAGFNADQTASLYRLV